MLFRCGCDEYNIHPQQVAFLSLLYKTARIIVRRRRRQLLRILWVEVGAVVVLLLMGGVNGQ
jgi:hypothetical protein